jgi:hypothetical protein
MKLDAEKFRRRSEETLEKSIDETVESEFEKMPSRKREQLSNELLNAGATIEVVRKSPT